VITGETGEADDEVDPPTGAGGAVGTGGLDGCGTGGCGLGVGVGGCGTGGCG